MSKFLHHVQAITHHRDQAMVDAAMLNSLIDFLGKPGRDFIVRLYQIDLVAGQRHITLTAWTENGRIHHEPIECEAAAAPEAMNRSLTSGTMDRGEMATGTGRRLHFAWLPVMRKKEQLACIEIGLRKPLTQTQIFFIDGMRGLYANYLSLLRYSQVDTLTQLLNRKTFDESLNNLLTATAARSFSHRKSERRAGSEQPTNWLAVMDIDHFKRVNDTYGHLFGDEVLILVANVMRKVFRRKDKLFRFGGEEFVVLLRDTTEVNALAAFERFRLAIEKHEFPQLGHVTISIGIAKVLAADNPTTLLGRADAALYHAKNHGRNQIQLYDRLEAEGKIARATVVHTEVEMF